VGGFVSFANSTGKTVSVSFQVIGSEGATLPPQSLSLPAYSTRMLDLDRLTLGLHGLENQAGGIRVQWQGSAADLAVNGGLENAREGFSSDMQFWSHDLMAAPAPSTMAAVGMMTGDPDPSLGYPAGTRFTPYAVLRNSTSRPLSVKLAVYEANGTQSFPLPLQVLKPLETVRVDVTPWLADAGRAYKSWALNLVLTYTGRKGDLVVDTGSLDQAGRYNMPVLVQPLDESLSQESPFWTVADEWDTMYLLWNWTDKAEDVVVTFYWSDGSGHFKLPVHLEAGGSATIDMAKVIARGQPDADGNVIPARVRQGSAIFASPKGVTSPISLAVWGVHFNARLGVAEACCLPCGGYSEVVLSFSTSDNPIGGFDSVVGQSIQLYALAIFFNGTVYNITGSATWSTTDTSVATVAGGLVKAVAAGSCTISASLTLQEEGQRAFGCGGCPGQQLMTGWATANVQKPAFLKVISNSTENETCSGGGTTCARLLNYQVLDLNGNPIQIAGMTIREHYSNVTGSCTTIINDSGVWTTDASGTMSPYVDRIRICCSSGSNCFTTLYQNFDVNYYPVVIINGSSSGGHNYIKLTCTNGTGSPCPTFSQVP
jgi:Bacterial Ig-like domain (group 2)